MLISSHSHSQDMLTSNPSRLLSSPNRCANRNPQLPELLLLRASHILCPSPSRRLLLM